MSLPPFSAEDQWKNPFSSFEHCADSYAQFKLHKLHAFSNNVKSLKEGILQGVQEIMCVASNPLQHIPRQHIFVQEIFKVPSAGDWEVAKS